MRMTAIQLTIVALLAACASSSPAESSASLASLSSASSTPLIPAGPSPSVSLPPSYGPIVGKWRGYQRCAEIVKALKKLGFMQYLADDIVGNGLRPDLTSNDQLDLKNPCKGAVDRVHYHDFYPDGRFDSVDFNGQQVDDGTFTTTPGHVTVNDVTFDVAFQGDTAATVTVKIPADCSTTECRDNYAWATMVTMPGSTWERVP